MAGARRTRTPVLPHSRGKCRRLTPSQETVNLGPRAKKLRRTTTSCRSATCDEASTTTLCLRDFRLAGGLARHCQVREKRCFRCIGGQARPLNVDGGTGDFVKCCRAAGYVKSLSERSVVVLGRQSRPADCSLIEPCRANERRASNGSPDFQAPAGITRSLAMQTSIIKAQAPEPNGCLPTIAKRFRPTVVFRHKSEKASVAGTPKGHYLPTERPFPVAQRGLSFCLSVSNRRVEAISSIGCGSLSRTRPSCP